MRRTTPFYVASLDENKELVIRQWSPGQAQSTQAGQISTSQVTTNNSDLEDVKDSSYQQPSCEPGVETQTQNQLKG